MNPLLRQKSINLRFRRGEGVSWREHRNKEGQTYLVIHATPKRARAMRDLLQEKLIELERILEGENG